MRMTDTNAKTALSLIGQTSALERRVQHEESQGQVPPTIVLYSPYGIGKIAESSYSQVEYTWL